jgi:hypothetical protein
MAWGDDNGHTHSWIPKQGFRIRSSKHKSIRGRKAEKQLNKPNLQVGETLLTFLFWLILEWRRLFEESKVVEDKSVVLRKAKCLKRF